MSRPRWPFPPGALPALAGAFLQVALVSGSVRALGLCLPPLGGAFGAPARAAAWVGSCPLAALQLGGPLAAALSARFGPRGVAMAGGALAGAGLVLSAFATRLEHLYLSLGGLTGLGWSLAFTPALGAVSSWFPRRRALATGLAVSGAAVSGLALSPLVPLALDAYGWRGALLLLGGVSLHMVAGGALLRPPRAVREPPGPSLGPPRPPPEPPELPPEPSEITQLLLRPPRAVRERPGPSPGHPGPPEPSLGPPEPSLGPPQPPLGPSEPPPEPPEPSEITQLLLRPPRAQTKPPELSLGPPGPPPELRPGPPEPPENLTYPDLTKLFHHHPPRAPPKPPEPPPEPPENHPDQTQLLQHLLPQTPPAPPAPPDPPDPPDPPEPLENHPELLPNPLGLPQLLQHRPPRAPPEPSPEPPAPPAPPDPPDPPDPPEPLENHPEPLPNPLGLPQLLQHRPPPEPPDPPDLLEKPPALWLLHHHPPQAPPAPPAPPAPSELLENHPEPPPDPPEPLENHPELLENHPEPPQTPLGLPQLLQHRPAQAPPAPPEPPAPPDPSEPLENHPEPPPDPPELLENHPEPPPDPPEPLENPPEPPQPPLGLPQLLQHRPFLRYAAAFALLDAGYYVPSVHGAGRALELGHGPSGAGLAVTTMALTDGLGRLAAGWLATRPSATLLTHLAAWAALTAVAALLFPLGRSLEGLVVISGVFGFCAGAVAPLQFSGVAEVVGTGREGLAIGVMQMVESVGSLLGAPLAGWLRDVTGDFGLSFVVAGAFLTASSLLILTLPRAPPEPPRTPP